MKLFGVSTDKNTTPLILTSEIALNESCNANKIRVKELTMEENINKAFGALSEIYAKFFPNGNQVEFIIMFGIVIFLIICLALSKLAEKN